MRGPGKPAQDGGAAAGGDFLRTAGAAAHHVEHRHIGKPLAERIAEDADTYAFLFRELGVKYTPVTSAKPGRR